MPLLVPVMSFTAAMTTVSNGTVMSVVASALSRGLSFKEVQDAAGIDCGTLMNPEARPPEDVMPKIVALLSEKFPGEPITLDIARAAPFSFFGGLAEGARYADDLRAAIDLLDSVTDWFARNKPELLD